ncbi:hypothetical protein DU000_03235 [Parvibium lacunae]|uniref:Uncharacterized protein n=1 Tax=Parvibium lacunae TaxID=1888893 RepID=A0A368L7Y5_9BURK|nr:hypothetical protein DU000_03235 [Parvibium lacunae]
MPCLQNTRAKNRKTLPKRPLQIGLGILLACARREAPTQAVATLGPVVGGYSRGSLSYCAHPKYAPTGSLGHFSDGDWSFHSHILSTHQKPNTTSQGGWQAATDLN